MMVADADGFRTVPPRRSGQQLGDFIPSSKPEPRNNNRFQPLSVADWHNVAQRVEKQKLPLASQAAPPPSSLCFPPLSRSTASGSTSPASPTAPSSGQGEVNTEVVHPKVSRFSCHSNVAKFISTSQSGRHVKLNSEEPADHCIDRVLG